jgi:hypothetical protein
LTGQAAAYAESAGHFARWTVTAGARAESFALTNAQTFEPRGSLSFRISDSQAIHLSYGRSAQLPPSINIVSFGQNSGLKPIQAEQLSIGGSLFRARLATISAEVYRKTYSNEPVSTEYPTLMLANMVDTLGQQFVWLPLRSGGRGHSEGVELLIRAQWTHRFQFLGSTTYARTFYAAADGAFRPGNFDVPLVANGLASVLLPVGIQASIRNSYASGRPYTPFNISLSEAQSRGIYDLLRINTVRGSAYNRLDIDLTRTFELRNRFLAVHAGVENVFNRANFLGYFWLQSCQAPWKATCGNTPTTEYGVPEARQSQMPRFPDFGVRLSF